jgi:hypothetical protein
MYYERVRYKLWSSEFNFEIREPINWKDDTKSFIRNEKYHGISVNLAADLQFTGDAYDFLAATVRDEGVNADIRLTREIKNENDEWELDYEGWVDFLSFKQEERIFTVSFFSDPLTNRLKSKQSAKVELERLDDLDGNSLPPFNIDTIYLKGRQILNTSKLSRNEDGAIFGLRGNSSQTYKCPQPLVETGDKDSGVLLINGQLVFNPRVYNNNNFVGENFIIFNDNPDTFTYRVQVKHKQSFFWYGANNTRIEYRLARYSGNANEQTFVDAVTLYDSQGAQLPRTIEFISPEITIEVPQNYTACLEWIVYPNQDGFEAYISYPLSVPGAGLFPQAGTWSDVNGLEEAQFGYYVAEDGSWQPAFFETSVTVQEDSQRPDSESNCVRIFECFERLSRIVLSADVTSTTLGRAGLKTYTEDGFLSDLVLLHGMWARGMKAGVDKYKPFSTSMADFYDSLDAVSPIGLDLVGDKVILEDRAYFYRKKITIRLGEVNDIQFMPSTKDYNSKITVGYSKAGGYEEEQGLDEYNRKTEYNTILNKTDSELDLVAKYRADFYGLETVRRENPDVGVDVEEDRDSKFDDEIWFVDAEAQDNSRQLTVSGWEKRFERAPSGVYSPETAYNIWLSPINIILRHGSFLKPPLLQYLDSYIKFNSSEGNSSLSTQLLGGNEYIQNVGVLVGDLEYARYKALTVSFRAPVSWDDLNGTTDGIKNYYGLVEFFYKGERYRGFLMKCELSDGIGTFEVKLS